LEHPTLGLIQPDEFIPILEQSGRIREVGRWVLGEACQQMATWHARGDTLDVSVNVSGRQLDDDTIVDIVRDALRISGLDPTTLIIEVTETALMRNTESTARRLQAMKNLGVKIAIDDFGTGLLLPRLSPTVPGRLHQDRKHVHQRDHHLTRIQGPHRYPGAIGSRPRPEDAGRRGRDHRRDGSPPSRKRCPAPRPRHARNEPRRPTVPSNRTDGDATRS